jgi:hypothetical protein
MNFHTPPDLINVQNSFDLLFVYKVSEIFDLIDKYIISFKFSTKTIGLIYLFTLLLRLVFMLHWSSCLW